MKWHPLHHLQIWSEGSKKCCIVAISRRSALLYGDETILKSGYTQRTAQRAR